RPVLVANIFETLGGTIERLLPCGNAKMRPGISRIDLVIGVLGYSVLADQRMMQPVLVMNVIKTETPLHTQPVLIGRSVAPGNVGKLVVLDVIGEQAADPAVGTNAVDLAVSRAGEDVVAVDQSRRHQGAGGTGLHALAACNAGRVAHGI